MSETLTIGDLARKTGCKVQTIRYYEEIGLMPPVRRTAGNQRRYGPAEAARLAFIRHGRELGFPLDDVRELLDLSDQPERSCDAADEVARRHLAAVEARIASLRTLKAELKRMIAACGQGQVADCRVIEVLADHSHASCLRADHRPARIGPQDRDF